MALVSPFPSARFSALSDLGSCLARFEKSHLERRDSCRHSVTRDRPRVRLLSLRLMPQDVCVSIIGAHFEVLMIGAVPAVCDLGHFEPAPFPNETQRPLVALVARIRFDAKVPFHFLRG